MITLECFFRYRDKIVHLCTCCRKTLYQNRTRSRKHRSIYIVHVHLSNKSLDIQFGTRGFKIKVISRILVLVSRSIHLENLLLKPHLDCRIFKEKVHGSKFLNFCILFMGFEHRIERIFLVESFPHPYVLKERKHPF